MRLKKVLNLISLVIIASIILSAPLSANAALPANPVFNTKSVTLSTSMASTFMATTSMDCNSISVTSVKLQRQNGSKWEDDKTLVCPSGVATNTDTLVTSKNYAADCVKGNTYRLFVTFTADGVTATCYSGTATYK